MLEINVWKCELIFPTKTTEKDRNNLKGYSLITYLMSSQTRKSFVRLRNTV